MTSELAQKQCEPCRGGVPTLSQDRIEDLLQQVHEEWSVDRQGHLRRTLKFPDFASAMDYANEVGAIAENQGHHPDLHISWGQVTVEVWTHKIDGLTESDFIFAAKCDEAYHGMNGRPEVGERG